MKNYVLSYPCAPRLEETRNRVLEKIQRVRLHHLKEIGDAYSLPDIDQPPELFRSVVAVASVVVKLIKGSDQ